jgi:hypothetical protein
MKLYARITSERDSRARNKGGNEFLHIELSAFGKVVGHLVLKITDDAAGRPMRYRLKFAPSLDSDEWGILKEGHQQADVLQTIKA